MNIDQKLTAIRDLIQQDVGNRGLARDPERNLINACPDDFAKACLSIAGQPEPSVAVCTGFFIPTASPAAFETDGPLGAVYLSRAYCSLAIPTLTITEGACARAIHAAHCRAKITEDKMTPDDFATHSERMMALNCLSTTANRKFKETCLIAIERVGPSKDGRSYTMRGRDVTANMRPFQFLQRPDRTTIGIGDGGNEIGMGKIPHETIVKNIPNGDLIHCRVPTDYLIVAGVSNWGAYALAAGVALLRGVELPAELFDPDREREILQVMVDAGPLVDGVTGKQEATVDGLSWDDYIKPLVEIGKIVRG